MWLQKTITLKPRSRGFHLITSEIIAGLPELARYEMGMLNIFIQHTSASLTINENADPAVRADFESFFNRTVPEDAAYFIHTEEGSDDMPAHLKASMLGFSVTIPVSMGKLALGTWQGLYLGEHRDSGGSRKLLITLQGQGMSKQLL